MEGVELLVVAFVCRTDDGVGSDVRSDTGICASCCRLATVLTHGNECWASSERPSDGLDDTVAQLNGSEKVENSWQAASENGPTIPPQTMRRDGTCARQCR